MNTSQERHEAIKQIIHFMEMNSDRSWKIDQIHNEVEAVKEWKKSRLRNVMQTLVRDGALTETSPDADGFKWYSYQRQPVAAIPRNPKGPESKSRESRLMKIRAAFLSGDIPKAEESDQ